MDEPILRVAVVGYAVLLTLSTVSFLKGWTRIGALGFLAGLLPLIGLAVILAADHLIDIEDAEEKGWVLLLFVMLPLIFLVGGALLIALGAAGWHSTKRAQPGSWWESTRPVFRLLVVLPGLVVVIALPTELVGLVRVTAAILVNTGIVGAGLTIGALIVGRKLLRRRRAARPARQFVRDRERVASSSTGASAEEPRHNGARPTGMVRLNTSFNRSMLFLFFIKPRLEVNDEPVPIAGWGHSNHEVTAGQVNVAVYFPYFILRRAGAAALRVDVPRNGEVSLRYRAPALVFLKGHLSIVPQTTAARTG